jgi:hypothetical protein
MVLPYICGFVNPIDMSYVDIPQPEDVYAFSGETRGGDNGMKGKQDRLGRFWFFACDNPITPTEIYLIRATDNGDGTYTLRWKQLPLIGTSYKPTPNQLTIDNSDNIYFPSGTLEGTGIPEYVVGKVTKAQFDSASALPASIWTIIAKQGATITGTFGIALNKAHTAIITYCQGVAGDPNYNDRVAVLTASTMAEARFDTMGALLHPPYNIETDVSGGVNDGLSMWVNASVSVKMYSSAAGTLTGQAVITTYEMSLSIKANGTVITTERYGRCNTNPDRKYEYTPGAGAGQLNAGSLGNLTCVVPEPSGGNTAGKSPTTHTDIRKATDELWIANGISSQGDVREITATTQIARSLRLYYLYLCTAAARGDT